MRLKINTNLLKGELREQEPMSKYTTWKTGGCADYFFRPADLKDLAVFMSMLPDDISILWIGFGSNMLVRDGGVEGVVISVSGILDTLMLIREDQIKVGAGLSCTKGARFATQYGLAGIEFLAGIPGTIGGALAMNAGAYGGEIWRYVEQVEIINRQGECKSRDKIQFNIGYRNVSLARDEWFISACLKLDISEKEKVEQCIRRFLAHRAETQPLGQYSCGSVFKNPPNDYAARLIDRCGLKGKQIGGAIISDKHANFIINLMQASSSDIERLIEYVQTMVNDKYGIKLIPEVQIVGKPVEVGARY